MKDMIGVRAWKAIVSIIIVICAACLNPNTNAATGQYQIDVDSGVDTLLGWPFQNKTVGNAFPNPGVFTQLKFWNSVSNSWLPTVTWDDLDGEWNLPNFVITNGVGFFYKHFAGVSVTITGSGDLITATNVTLNLVGGNWNLITDPYLRSSHGHGHWMECVYRISTPFDAPYTTIGLNFSGSTGDIASLWSTSISDVESGIRTSSVNCTFAPFWGKPDPAYECEQPQHVPWGSSVSPQMQTGRGFWFKPVSNRTWIVPDLNNEVDCN